MEEITLNDGRKVTIRSVNAKDVDAIVVYMNQIATETIFTNQYIGKSINKEKYAQAYKDENKLFLAAFDASGRVVANASLMIVKPDHPWLCKNASFGVAILKEYYGQGLGTRLLQKLDIWAKEHHLHSIEGKVYAINRRAISLYLRQGFEICGHLKETILVDNVWYDEYIVQKIIKE